MTFLLDTSALSSLMRDESRMETWMASIPPQDRLVICTIVRGEILFGLARLATGRRRQDLEARAQGLFRLFDCESIRPEVGDLYASLKLAQQRRGFSLADNDLWIAATAIAIEATLVSLDGDFGRIDGLSLIRP